MVRRSIAFLLSRLGYATVTQAELAREAPYGDPAVEPEYRQLCDDIEASGFVPAKNDAVHYTTYSALKYVVENNIPGDIIECGVHLGDKMVLACQFLRKRNVLDRHVYLYDTFSGMTPPTPKDKKVSGLLTTNAGVVEKFEQSQRTTHNDWCYGSKDEVMRNVLATGYPPEMVHFVEGDVLQTMPNGHHSKIAFLRLDTDFYDSTLHELRHLYSLVVRGGVIIFDDYGSWQGQKEATDEFFQSELLSPFLLRTCRKERLIIKS
jgi:O-methyltransferase